MSSGSKVKVTLIEENVFSLSSTWNSLFKTSADVYSKRLALGFADPPWGLNRDPKRFGGIDLQEERWNRCVYFFIPVELKSVF